MSGRAQLSLYFYTFLREVIDYKYPPLRIQTNARGILLSNFKLIFLISIVKKRCSFTKNIVHFSFLMRMSFILPIACKQSFLDLVNLFILKFQSICEDFYPTVSNSTYDYSKLMNIFIAMNFFNFCNVKTILLCYKKCKACILTCVVLFFGSWQMKQKHSGYSLQGVNSICMTPGRIEI